jgi:hypothetical protein
VASKAERGGLCQNIATGLEEFETRLAKHTAS